MDADIRSLLKTELNQVNETLLSLDCGEVNPDTLPMAPKFYTTKKERLEALLWLYEVEKRMKNKIENATDRDS